MISRWTDFLTTDGEKPSRNREQEFEEDTFSKQKIIAIWEKGWHTLLDTLRGLGNEDLLKDVMIRGEKHTVLEAIERQMAHYAYHIGQIVYIGKQLKQESGKTLSIPKGQSDIYTQGMLEEHLK